MYHLLCDLFWFRKLPESGNKKDPAFFLSEFSQFINHDDDLMSGEMLGLDIKRMFSDWVLAQVSNKSSTSLYNNIQNNNINSELDLNIGKTHSCLKGLVEGQFLPLYIQNCNATLLIQKMKDETATLSVFTIHPKNCDVMSAQADLVVNYPEITVKVEAGNGSLMCSEEFSQLLYDLFHNQIESIVPESKKAGKDVKEERDVVSSRIITEWMVAMLGGKLGSSVNTLEKRITIEKKLRNSIQWKDSLLPYRRSGLWISIKTVLQLVLFWKYGQYGLVLYKTILLRYFIHVATRYSSHMDDEMQLQVIMKISKRLKKLEQSGVQMKKPEIVKNNAKLSQTSKQSKGVNLDEALSSQKTSKERIEIHSSNIFEDTFSIVMKYVREQKILLDRNWKRISGNYSRMDLTLGDVNDPSNLRQSLTNSIEVIERYFKLGDSQSSIPKSVPPSIERVFDVSTFTAIKNCTGNVESICELFVIQEWVRIDMMSDRKCTSSNLENLLVQYKNTAKLIYEKDPIGYSRIILTCLNIIRKLIEFAKGKIAFFSDYTTQIDLSLFNYLLLTTRDQMKYAYELETYFTNYEKSATHSKPHFHDTITERSFSSRYARRNLFMRTQRHKIEQEMELSILQKYEEVELMQKKYHSLISQSEMLNHTYKYNSENESKIHLKSNCQKCIFKEQAESLCVSPYEKVLPDTQEKKDAVVFELNIPDEFRCFRNSLIEFSELVHEYDPLEKATKCTKIWKEYLHEHNQNNGRNRISLTSSSKPYMVSHYSKQKLHPTTAKEEYIVPNALDLKFAVDSKYVMFYEASISDECAFSTSGNYVKLQNYLKDYSQNQNMVLSKQSDCDPKLGLEEFISFGTFRAGHRLQLHNLAKALANHTLSFNQESVCFLILQSLLQTCPSEGNWWRSSSDAMRDEIFCHGLLSLLEQTLKNIESNWQSVYTLTIVIFCSKKLIETSENLEVISKSEELLTYGRNICLQWLDKTEKVLVDIIDSPIESSNIRNLQIDIACCCCLTFHPFSSILKDMSSWLVARSIVNDNLILNNVGVSTLSQYRKTMLRETFRISLLLEESIYYQLNHDKQQLTVFLKGKWLEIKNRELSLTWKQYDTSNNWFFTEINQCKVQVDVINGSLLINYAPIGRLPKNISSSPEYQRLFKNKVLDVQPGLDPNSFITKNTFGEYFFKFKSINKTILISQISKSKKEELYYLPHTSFTGDFPTLLVEKYSHWLDKKSMSVLFGTTVLESNFSKYEYKLSLKDRLLSTISNESFLLDKNRDSFKKVMAIMSRIEDSNFVHVQLQSNTLIVHLPRKGLTFKWENNSHFTCLQFGMKLEDHFGIGTLVGLKKGILLSDREKQVILIPNGPISIEKSDGHIYVDIDLSQVSTPAYYSYTINKHLGYLEGEGNMSSWLFLAYLHGCTSYILPDPFTKMCGYETALSILKSKRCFQLHELDPSEQNLLELISSLSPKRNFYPLYLQEMQITEWNSNLKSLVQLDSYAILCNRIQENTGPTSMVSSSKTNIILYWRSYFKDMNYYTKDCEIDSGSIVPEAIPFCWSIYRSKERDTILEMSSKLCISLERNKLHWFDTEKISLLEKHSSESIDSFGEWMKKGLVQTDFSNLDTKIREMKKNDVIFRLSLMLYLGEDSTLIHLLGFIFLNRSQLPKCPPCQYNRSVRDYEVSEEEIKTILYSNKKRFGLIFDVCNETNRIRYERLIASEQKLLSNKLVHLYSTFKHSDIDLEIETSNVFHTTMKDSIRSLFIERKRNFILHEYMSSIKKLKRKLISESAAQPMISPLNFLNNESIRKPKWKIPNDDHRKRMELISSSLLRESTLIFDTGKYSGNFDHLYQDILKCIESVWMPQDGTPNQALYMSGLWKRITIFNILQLILDEETDNRFKNLVGSYGVLLTLLQRSERLQKLEKDSNMSTLYKRELENTGHENWKPSQYPMWLILEIEMNILIRPIQIKVANHMMNSPNNFVMQLNMGEGKTHVIIPMLILELGRSKKQLVRLTVLKSLLNVNYQSLRFKLGGMLDKPVVFMPFNRDSNTLNSNYLLARFRECVKQGGVYLTVPEYRLSFELKCVEKITTDIEQSWSLFEVHQWLEDNCRDILDESDEILHARHQLIYTVGNQLEIDGSYLRWHVCQKLFRSIKMYAAQACKIYGPSCVEYVGEDHVHSFPHFRVIDTKASDFLIRKIVDDILDGKVKGVYISVRTTNRELLEQFLLREEINESALKEVQQVCNPTQWKTLLILRGLLAYGTLKHVLTRRWRVNYGVGNKIQNRLIAVPFRAKDVASERAEYGHPDVSILLTLLSYYYEGLDNSKLEYVFQELALLDDPDKEYSKWVEEAGSQIPEHLKSYSNINQYLGIAPKPHSPKEDRACKRGQIDENGVIEFNSSHHQSLTFRRSVHFDFNDLIERLTSIHDRDKSFQDSHLYRIVKECQKPFFGQ